MYPITLTSRTRRKSSSGISWNGEKAVTAALFTPASIRPKRSSARRASACTASASVTSVGTASAFPQRPAHFLNAAVAAGESAPETVLAA
jgi:hypothetical protein